MVLAETEVSCFFSKFFLVHLMSVAKSWWKWGPTMAKLVKIFQKWHISLEFQPEVVLFPPEVSCFFKFFKASPYVCGKKFWKFDLDLLKMLKKSKNQIFQGFTLCLWQKVGENGLRKWQNCKKTEAELDFLRKIKFLKASPQYFGKKLRNFSNFKPNKQNFFF